MSEENKLQVRPLETIENEINFYKQQTAIGIIEIGKRLIEAKEQLPHGEWGKWLEERVEFSNVTATRFMRVAKEGGNLSTLKDLSQSKIFALLDIPQEEREEFISNPHEVNGQTKTVDEMTSRELQKVIKEKKELENKINDKEKETEQLKQELEKEKNKPKEKEYVETVIDKTDYNKINQLNNELKQKENELSNVNDKTILLEKELYIYKQDSKEYEQFKKDIETLTQTKENLGRQINGIKETTRLSDIDEFLKGKLAPVKYSKSILDCKNEEIVIENLSEIINMVENWCYEIKNIIPNLNNNNFVEGMVIE
jgi:chromosome segregation ATPase